MHSLFPLLLPKIVYNTSKLNNVTYSIRNSDSLFTIYLLPVTNPHSQLTIYRLPLYLFVQNEPNLEKRPNERKLSYHKWLRQYARLRTAKNEPKTNPNEPKQSQSHPHFSPVIAPQTQNTPKHTQTKPIPNAAAVTITACFHSSDFVGEPDQPSHNQRRATWPSGSSKPSILLRVQPDNMSRSAIF